jgi:hypothetical protein
MHGFKTFHNPHTLIEGIETMHMTKKGKLAAATINLTRSQPALHIAS